MKNDVRLDGQVAVVTGGARGLGRAYADLLAARGAQVVVNNRIRLGTESERPVAEIAAEAICLKGGSAVANTADIGTQTGAASVIESALEAFGRIDILINNAGIVHFQHFENYPLEEYREMLAIQFESTWHITQAAWPHFCDQNYGRVVNTVSRAAFFGDPQGAAYAASKGGVYGLTRALAVEGQSHGIKVNAISPTAWTPLYSRAPDVSPERRKMLEDDFQPDRVAPVVVALAHRSVPFTGEVIGAAGGHVSRIYVTQTRGVQLDASVSPETIIESFPKIWDETESAPMGLVVADARGSGTPVTENPFSSKPII
ncbi:SDR family NAD(P)-dependent oxidoreductase [Pseudarthrobacter sp. IC2-21]|uniref:SDR family NAD(P)-dependent oxidoreductase n=1 Tax=Pseudarthrobacter sp. IC2-21 TaxID=3092262 RepID=UPI002A6AE71B|nr:SDR family NAD(P)-dependent oxidoreductase [Pseudarthrobacter sp. IC2-21]